MKKSIITVATLLLSASAVNAAEVDNLAFSLLLKKGFFLLFSLIVILSILWLRKSRNKDYLDPSASAYYYYPKR